MEATTSQPFIERDAPGRPHEGKVLAVVEPHLDDVLLFAGGTLAKLLAEGYDGYLIRVTNDEMCGYRTSIGETVASAERDTVEVAKYLGLHPPIDLGYRNHQLDDVSRNALRARLIFLFRVLKVDTVMTYDPRGGGHYETNPEHQVVAEEATTACWHAGYWNDYPEHRLAGIAPHAVTELYYFARGPQDVTRVVDTSSYADTKLKSIVRARTALMQLLYEYRDYTRARGINVEWLNASDDVALKEYVRRQSMAHDERIGARYGLACAEQFHHMILDDTFVFAEENPLFGSSAST